jgi:hypothetical protein
MTPMDDREARELLGPLAGEPGGTQWLDVDRIVRDGDRRRRTRTIGTGTLTAVFLMTVAAGTTAIVVNGRQADGMPSAGYGSASASAPPSLPSAPTGPDCTLSALPGPTGLLAAVDHTGHYTLQEVSVGKKRTAVVRKDGVRVTGVEVEAPGRAGGEYELNAKGEFTAIITDFSKNRPAVSSYAYTAGKLTELKGDADGDGDAFAVAIADDGRIAGTIYQTPVIWQRPDAAPEELKVPPGERAQITSFDQDGTVLGYANNAVSQFARVWLPDGTSQAIPAREGQTFVTLTGIANGWVVGFTNVHGFRYHVATKKYEVLPAQVFRPHAVATNGTVVGDDGTDGNLSVWDGGTARKLPVRPAMQHYTVLGISDDGRTVTANEYYPSPPDDPQGETGRAVTWSCG